MRRSHDSLAGSVRNRQELRGPSVQTSVAGWKNKKIIYEAHLYESKRMLKKEKDEFTQSSMSASCISLNFSSGKDTSVTFYMLTVFGGSPFTRFDMMVIMGGIPTPP